MSRNPAQPLTTRSEKVGERETRLISSLAWRPTKGLSWLPRLPRLPLLHDSTLEYCHLCDVTVFVNVKKHRAKNKSCGQLIIFSADDGGSTNVGPRNVHHILQQKIPSVLEVLSLFPKTHKEWRIQRRCTTSCDWKLQSCCEQARQHTWHGESLKWQYLSDNSRALDGFTYPVVATQPA